MDIEYSWSGNVAFSGSLEQPDLMERASYNFMQISMMADARKPTEKCQIVHAKRVVVNPPIPDLFVGFAL